MPPYLAGRQEERREFEKLLQQQRILQNMVLTGLRGVGKTVLLETLKPIAMGSTWVWVGTDLSESSSISEGALCTRVLTDIATFTSRIQLPTTSRPIGFRSRNERNVVNLDYAVLVKIFNDTPGLNSDKLKNVLESVWQVLKGLDVRGVVFAYDEAQNMADHASKEEYPLSLLLDVFQSMQKKGVPYLLALTGLPTLFPKLVDARTYSERMFRIIHLERLETADSKDAICKPIEDAKCPVQLSDYLIDQIISESGGYPYFIQFICREVYDLALQRVKNGLPLSVAIPDITRKLDRDFFAGRWAKVTDRQRELLVLAANLQRSETEFTVQEIVEASQHSSTATKPFSPSHAGQILAALAEAGLVYKNRHGRYLFAVPLLGRFIRRQIAETPDIPKRSKTAKRAVKS